MRIVHFAIYQVLIFTLVASNAYCDSSKSGQALEPDGHLRKIYAQFDLIRAGNQLMDQGLLDEAILKYEEAMEPEYLNYEYDKASPLGHICSVLKFQHKYEESLKRWQWFIDFNPKGDGWVPQKRELEALLEAQKTGNTTKLYEHIKYLREKHQKWMPPKGYHTSTAGVSSVIIQLYDHIGDQDAGIAFCDEMIEFCASGKSCRGNDSRKYAYSMKNPYFQIKQAFEQDKAESFKGCLDAKPDDACMGRATKALIQSDYFPW